MKAKSPKNNVKNVELHLKAVIESIAGNHWWKDINGRYMGFNGSLVRALGFKSSREIIGKTDYELFLAEAAQELIKNDKEVITKGKPLTYEELVPTVDGKMLVFLVTKVPLKDENGNVTGTIGTSVDITELKNTQAQLKIAKEKAEEANQAKSEFISNISHDLRTPLSGMVGVSQLLEKRVPQKDQKIAHQIAEASKVLLNLFDEVIEYIKTGGEKLPLQEDQFAITKLVSDMVVLLELAAKEKKLQLKVKLDSAIPHYLIGDSSRIHRILLNLVSNAIKFTKKGFVEIRVTLAEEKEREVVLKIVIEDTGIGMPADKLDQIFTRFTRLTAAYQGNFKGFGLGLSIVKQFIQDMSGEIYVESKLNKGSKFICVLPLKKSLLRESVIESEKNQRIFKTSIRQKKIAVNAKMPKNFPDLLNHANPPNVLLVEDDLLSQTVGKNNLEAFNCIVDVARNGYQAIKMFKKKTYHLVLTDIGLPDINGYEVTAAIRKLQEKASHRIPIIGVTAHVDMEVKQHCEQVAMDEVLTKPLMPEIIRDILEVHLKMEEIQEAITHAHQEESPQHPNIIDLDLGATLMGGSLESAKDMLKMLVEELPTHKKNIETAYKENNYAELRRVVHKLYGGACSCGTLKLKEASRDLNGLLVNFAKKPAIKVSYKHLIAQITAVLHAYKELEE